MNTTDFSSPFEFSKLCLMVEAKIIIPPDLTLNECRENT